MDRDPLMLSGIQHFAYCRRQWALIHIEQQWAENERTVSGDIMHRRAHDAQQTELRGDKLTMRGVRIRSNEMNITGICDVVEFHRNPEGIELTGYDGRWSVYPVEYKRGEPKLYDADELQLCAQAMCLEEMLLCRIEEGSLFYGETRRRERVIFTDELRQRVKQMFEEMHQYFMRGYTPSAKPDKGCNACSLKGLCLPRLKKTPQVREYLNRHIKEASE